MIKIICSFGFTSLMFEKLIDIYVNENDTCTLNAKQQFVNKQYILTY